MVWGWIDKQKGLWPGTTHLMSPFSMNDGVYTDSGIRETKLYLNFFLLKGRFFFKDLE